MNYLYYNELFVYLYCTKVNDMKKEITVDDVVNLIIDKKIKEVEDAISKKDTLAKQMKDDFIKESYEHIKKVFEENFDEKGLNCFLSMAHRNRHNTENKKTYQELCVMGLSPKNSKYEEIEKLYDEKEELYNMKIKIRNSKERIKIEITLQRISSIDVNFDKKLDELAERIFSNKQLQ